MVSKSEDVPSEVLCQQQLDFSAQSWVSSVTGTKESLDLDTISPARHRAQLRKIVRGRIEAFRDQFSRAKSWHGEREPRLDRENHFIGRKLVKVRNRDIELPVDFHHNGRTMHHHNKGLKLEDKLSPYGSGLSASDPNLVTLCSSPNSHDGSKGSRDTPKDQLNTLARIISKKQNDRAERKRFQAAIQLRALKFGSPVLPSRSESVSSPSSDSLKSPNTEELPAERLVNGSPSKESTKESSKKVQGVTVEDALGYEKVSRNTRPVDRSPVVSMLRERLQDNAIGDTIQRTSVSARLQRKTSPGSFSKSTGCHGSVTSGNEHGVHEVRMFDSLNDVSKHGSIVQSCRGELIATNPILPSFQRKTSKDNIPKPAMREDSECNHNRRDTWDPPAFQRKSSKDKLPKPAMREESDCIHYRMLAERTDPFESRSSEVEKPSAGVSDGSQTGLCELNPPPEGDALSWKNKPQDLGGNKGPRLHNCLNASAEEIEEEHSSTSEPLSANTSSQAFMNPGSLKNLVSGLKEEENEGNDAGGKLQGYQRRTVGDPVLRLHECSESSVHQRMEQATQEDDDGGRTDNSIEAQSVSKFCQRWQRNDPQRVHSCNNATPSTFHEPLPQIPQRRASVSATSVVSDITFACSADDSPPICLSRWGDYIDELTEDIDCYERCHQSWSHPDA